MPDKLRVLLGEKKLEYLVVVILSLSFVFIVSGNIQKSDPNDGYDSPRHINYVWHIKNGLGIPYRFENGEETYVPNHPALYYYLASFFVSKDLNFESLRRLQYGTTLIVLSFALVAYLIFRELNISLATRLLAVGLLLFSPTVLTTSRMITNEFLSQLFAITSVLFVVKFVRKDRGLYFILAAIFLALAINTKISHLILFPLYFGLLAYLTIKRKTKKYLHLAVILFMALLTFSPFVMQNFQRYGAPFAPNSTPMPYTTDFTLYFLTFDPAIIQRPFYPTTILTSMWSSLYGFTFSDYLGVLKPASQFVSGQCVTSFPGIYGFILCRSYQSYLILAKLGIFVVLFFGIGFFVRVVMNKKTEEMKVYIAASLAYLAFLIALVVTYPDLPGGIGGKTVYILTFMPFFYYLVAAGFLLVLGFKFKNLLAKWLVRMTLLGFLGFYLAVNLWGMVL